MRESRFGFADLGIGVGLRTVHFGHVLEHRPEIDFFEIISENFMDTEGRPAWVLDQISERTPIAMHGVSLSIGSTAQLSRDYLTRLKRLAARCRARLVSDHLCWTGVHGRNSHDLLPLPYNQDALDHIVPRIKEVQDFLERPIALENPSSYLEFAASDMSEWEFMAALAREADCAILLDVNNIYVSSVNHGFEPRDYLAAIPWERVALIHIAGHTDQGTHLLDTHIGPVPPPVFALLAAALDAGGNRSILLEWDEQIPDFPTVHAEALKAKAMRAASARPRAEASA